MINQDSQPINQPTNTNQNQIQEVRDNPEPVQEPEIIEDEPEEVPELVEEPEEEIETRAEPQDVEVSLDQSGLPRFAAVPQTQTVIARAPLTPATARYILLFTFSYF